jgi:AcrR family transcriptional regulator
MANTAAVPRSKKGAKTRTRLMDAAKTVFERDGFLDARIVDIAETAGLAAGSFYHYFDSKEQIFREVAQAQEERLTAPSDDGDDTRAKASDAPSSWERIRRANRRYLERYRDEAALMGVIEQVSRYDAEVNAARMATMKHFVERAERAIRRMQRDKLVDRKVNPTFAADALGAMVARFAEIWLVQGYRDYDFDEAVEQLTLLWGNALGLEPEPGPRNRRHRARSS